ncbi:VOC family protein [Bacillus haikouensis]|jgi:predicted enzyme related to lactoylglutathione lyase|uniref:VOC family protein n=1 Tax=Bacillus haikouensis TaxID=1510468 RepID=UPI0015582D94|nr:VOC family protein [Bacillus haikouensis]NQD66017.1 VOC family protein [Bacillus haikouensis]
MQSPIINQINTVFVHVSSLKESVNWYSELLGLEYDLESVLEPVYNIRINHHTGLTLDAGPEGMIKHVKADEYPLFNFHTEDIDSSYSFVQEKGYEVVSGIIRFADFSFFTISDPDGHVVMICTG